MDPELAALQNAIQVLHHLMTVMNDPQDVAVVSTCLRNLTQLQQKLMQAAGPPGAAAGGPPGGGLNPMIAALAARLGAGGGPPGLPPGLGPGGPPGPPMMAPGGP
jgi:hypothetical protein